MGNYHKAALLFIYKGERGNKPYGLELMLRIHILQNLYNPAAEAVACEAIDSRAFSELCEVDSSNQVPDGDTIGRFRKILVCNGLEQKIFAQVAIPLQKAVEEGNHSRLNLYRSAFLNEK